MVKWIRDDNENNFWGKMLSKILLSRLYNQHDDDYPQTPFCMNLIQDAFELNTSRNSSHSQLKKIVNSPTFFSSYHPTST